MSDQPESRTPYFGLRDFLFYLAPGFVFFVAALIFTGSFPRALRADLGLGAALIGVFASYVVGQAGYAANYPLRRLVYGGFRSVRRRPPCPLYPSRDSNTANRRPSADATAADQTKTDARPETGNEERAGVVESVLIRHCREECPVFKRSHERTLRAPHDAYQEEIIRYRSLARFATAMVVPVGLLSLVAAAHRALIWQPQGPIAPESLISSLGRTARSFVFAGLGLVVAACFAVRARRYQHRFLELVLHAAPCDGLRNLERAGNKHASLEPR